MSKKESGYNLIDINELILDTNNPRLPSSFRGRDEREIINHMLLDASLIELMLAIGKNDFFRGEQLLVVYDDELKKYKVIEGNRRLSAVKLLNNPDLADYQKSKVKKVLDETEYRPTKIPCLIFDNENEITQYLGYRHITGIKEWKLLEKASYLFSIWKNNYENKAIKDVSREIAKSIGSRSDYVKRILVGYRVYEEIKDNAFFKIHGLNDTNFHFNYIADSLNKKNISDFLGIDLHNLSEQEDIKIDIRNLKLWTHWFFEKNQDGKTRLIGDSSTLQKLNKVLGDEESFKEFVEHNKSLDASLDLTADYIDQFYSNIDKSVKNLESADSLLVRIIENESVEIEKELSIIKRLISRIQRTIEEQSYE